MNRLLYLLTLLMALPLGAQQAITLQDCYKLASTNYPLAKQSALLKHQNDLDLEVISNGKLPQFELSAQATYQSDVTSVPLPNTNIEPLNKDQYRATFSVNQLIYNGGLINASTKSKSAQLKTQQKQVEVSLYQIKKQINQLYFSILLIQEKKQLLTNKQTQIKTQLLEVKSGIKNGVILPSSDHVLEAELLKIAQQFQEIENNKIVLIENLSTLIATPLSLETTFETPITNAVLGKAINRPELELFQLRKEEITLNETLIGKQNAPKFLGFATGGYGNPGLNMLDNSFQTFYTVGLKLNWQVFDWNSNKKQRESLAIAKDLVETEAETFKLNTTMERTAQEKEIATISELIQLDNDIIALRKKVLEATQSQLRNGVITTSAYVTELTHLNDAENGLATHLIQLELTKANYNITTGH
ncbi:TolC family protein [Mariniflexile maritimum]|uniref:TolC family protein n=1 Tax=Mariniflexile maritimum TaxID=2682493 RepID=UPI0012F6FBAB|nr:TolC family protein [Mariniflexile maritimum]